MTPSVQTLYLDGHHFREKDLGSCEEKLEESLSGRKGDEIGMGMTSGADSPQNSSISEFLMASLNFPLLKGQ